ncbi:trimethylamine methyltransferase family protein [Pelagibius sp. Alg239-R121]|uniref:trimethylamine methyltransferase family protein n=1 Tax=Pelagibius sp. Alg239-R121 TaxID=2993448 RepID=UPI0024A794E8|nr:trimethylamine methyltransferase family protein [Pelagibius sp. Alg239-R121]
MPIRPEMIVERPQDADAVKPKARRGRKTRAKARAEGTDQQRSPVWPGMIGGQYQPLKATDIAKIHEAILTILETTGLSEAPDEMIARVTATGGRATDAGRLTFPRGLVERALAGLRRGFVLHGQKPGCEMDLSGKRVHMGSGGASPNIIDLESGRYRGSMLRDLYDAARLVDALPNIHFFSRSLVARDMPDALSLDLNTAYASLAGTAKHVCVSVSEPAYVSEIAALCFEIAGSKEAFVERPFLSININHVIPPMRFAGDACAVMEQAVSLDIPVHANSIGQSGASSPVSMAGSVVQTVAETLAGMVFAWLVNPRARVIFGAKPMITDLRTGAMTGGGGEQATLMAAAVQMAQYYDLPNASIAGATDSKIPDAQSGYEKSLSVTLAAQAGSNMITQACGMQASLMGCSFESYVIDNDMLGGILRAISAIEVNAETLSAEVIDEVVKGDGHYLGNIQTLERMETDFLYPQVADRCSPDDWERNGARDIRQPARDLAREILSSHFPKHIDDVTDDVLRARFDIRLPKETMMPQKVGA